MPSGLLFDVDGTLVTFKFDVKGTRRAMLDELESRGLDTTGLDLSTPTQQIIDRAKELVRLKGGTGDFESLRQGLYSILDEFEEESSRLAEVFPGTRDTLVSLKKMALRLAVLTNSGRRAAEVVLRKGGLYDCFEFVLTREDVGMMKPSPEGILLALRRFDLPREEVYYVGDGLLDITAAKRARLKVVSVATGNYTPEKLRQEGADIVISSLKGLPEVLRPTGRIAPGG